MNETPAMIRQQMEQTKLQLAEKLESLERQVSTTVHTQNSSRGRPAKALLTQAPQRTQSRIAPGSSMLHAVRGKMFGRAPDS